MPRLLKDFPMIVPGDLGTFAVDFAPFLPPDASLVSAQWTLGLHGVQPGTIPDPAPQSRLVGPGWIAPDSRTPPLNTVAAQRIGGALAAGQDYLVTVRGTSSDGEVVTVWTVLPCRAPQ